jgi:uncharacterized protein
MTTQETLSPVSGNERISAMDIIRGIALLGILLMNIVEFGLHGAYLDPTVSGGATGWNFNVWWITSMFFEGTMRGMFSMLFGAGIVLFTYRYTENFQRVSATDLYFRRILWLFLFGIIHCYLLLWHGEILYCYAITGLFAYSFRVWTPKHLVIGAIVVLSITTSLNVKDYYQYKNTFSRATEALTKKDQGKILTKEENHAIERWQATVAEKKPSQEIINEDIAAKSKGYFSIMMYKLPINQFWQTIFIYRYNFLDTFAMMLLGMAFVKNGIFKASKSNKYYIIMALVGYSIGLTTNYLETDYIVSHQFEIIPMLLSFITYDFGRVFTSLGHIAAIMLFIKSGTLPFLQKSLAAVGQMAFTNYIMQTIICNLIFMGFGLALYGKLQRYELYYIVFAVWLFQLIASPIWMRYFRSGPLEWAWRSLTYWKRQPFRRINP